MRLFRIDEAAQRLGLSTDFLELLEAEGRIEAAEKPSGVSYYSQAALDHMIHGLLARIEEASWNDMELRMEAVEKQVEDLAAELKKLTPGGSPQRPML